MYKEQKQINVLRDPGINERIIKWKIEK